MNGTLLHLNDLSLAAVVEEPVADCSTRHMPFHRSRDVSLIRSNGGH
ncbi:hypothetical protein KR100_13800 [Synechococcus sp. KORDI-100]|nr:hypothetical protein KR100_13800 [Synechococcus sp. KORDI-100]